MCLAVNELIRLQGGFVLVQGGKVYDSLALPIMGLMCDCGFTEANAHLENMKQKAHEMGVPGGMDPFISLSFLALPVIPEIRITPRGLCLVQNGRPRLIQ
jgi:adenine deaminase 3